MADKNLEATLDRILAAMESGVIPWQKPWDENHVYDDTPRNMATGKPYHGFNLITLSSWLTGYTSPFWGTFKQINKLGGKIKKGEKHSVVVFWKTFDKTEITEHLDPATGQIVVTQSQKKIPFLQTSMVWNYEQCEGLPEKFAATTEVSPIRPVPDIIANWHNKPEIRWAGNRAFYTVTTDTLTIPPYEQFHDETGYVSTLFHEAAHATGHASRLNRTFGKRFGDTEYSKEELIAEIASAFLCVVSGNPFKVDDTAAYLQHWLTALKSDKMMLVYAASAANKVVEYIVNNKSGDNFADDTAPAYISSD